MATQVPVPEGLCWRHRHSGWHTRIDFIELDERCRDDPSQASALPPAFLERWVRFYPSQRQGESLVIQSEDGYDVGVNCEVVDGTVQWATGNDLYHIYDDGVVLRLDGWYVDEEERIFTPAEARAAYEVQQAEYRTERAEREEERVRTYPDRLLALQERERVAVDLADSLGFALQGQGELDPDRDTTARRYRVITPERVVGGEDYGMSLIDAVRWLERETN